MRRDRIALQLSSLRSPMTDGPPGMPNTLAAVSAWLRDLASLATGPAAA